MCSTVGILVPSHVEKNEFFCERAWTRRESAVANFLAVGHVSSPGAR